MEEQLTDALTAVERLDHRRVTVTTAMDRKRRAALGQFFTPSVVARYMASLLDCVPGDCAQLLDAGAGIGSLTAAVARSAPRTHFKASCYELEQDFHNELAVTLAELPNVTPTIEKRDFIEHAVLLVASGNLPGYTHVVLNPPYKKINNGSKHRMLMRKLGVETPNLYTCFIACAVALCAPRAQVVAIIPRSFMNGPYFRRFRYWLLDRVAISHVHVFDRRDKSFADDDVLQENVIIRLVVGGNQGPVDVSSSHDHSFSDTRHRACQFSEIVATDDFERFLHVPTLGSPTSKGLPGRTLFELGLDVCTGPVVDFRLREHIHLQAEAGAVPLLYASHFAGGHFLWPRNGRKANSIDRNSATEKWLMPKGCYVVLRRFSSKEEKRRVVAYFFDGRELPGDVVGFENHLNVIHQDRAGLSTTLARGLVEYLNSRAVDDYFRVFSGHTQVNATDLRRLRFPSRKELEALGRTARAQKSRRGAENIA